MPGRAAVLTPRPQPDYPTPAGPAGRSPLGLQGHNPKHTPYLSQPAARRCKAQPLEGGAARGGRRGAELIIRPKMRKARRGLARRGSRGRRPIPSRLPADADALRGDGARTARPARRRTHQDAIDSAWPGRAAHGAPAATIPSPPRAIPPRPARNTRTPPAPRAGAEKIRTEWGGITIKIRRYNELMEEMTGRSRPGGPQGPGRAGRRAPGRLPRAWSRAVRPGAPHSAVTSTPRAAHSGGTPTGEEGGENKKNGLRFPLA